jgi:integrase
VEAPVARAAVDRQPLRLVQPEMQVLTDAEIARPWTAYGELAADAARNSRPWWSVARRLVFVALGTALRQGELLALRWRDTSMAMEVTPVRVWKKGLTFLQIGRFPCPCRITWITKQRATGTRE